MLLQLSGKPGLCDGRDRNTSKQHTDQDAEEGKSSNTLVPAALFLKRDWVSFKEEIPSFVSLAGSLCGVYIARRQI
jgi:hypothetical protein